MDQGSPPNSPTTDPSNGGIGGGTAAYSPLVLRLAEEFGVDLSTVAGTGPGGRVTRADVQAAAFPADAEPATATTLPASTSRPEHPRSEPVPAPPDDPEPTPAPSAPAPDEAPGPGPTLPRPVSTAAELAATTLEHPHPPPPPEPPGQFPVVASPGVAPTPALKPSPASAPEPRPEPAHEPRIEGDARQPLSDEHRRATAGLTRAWTVPQFSVLVDVDVDQLQRARKRLVAPTGDELPIEALLIRLALPALDQIPHMNAMLDGGEVVLFERRDIGFTCHTGRGLVVPVVRHADRLSLEELGHAVADLAQRARRDQLHPTEVGSQTFTVNEVGTLGARAMTPLLPLATTAIVTYGRVQQVVRMVDDKPREVQVMTITGTFDHRVVDSSEATGFLATLGAYLEDPILAFAR